MKIVQYLRDILCTIRHLAYLASQQNLASFHILAVIYPSYPSPYPFPHKPNKWHATSTLEDQGRHPSPSEKPLSGIQGRQLNYRIEMMTKETASTEVVFRIEKMNIGYFRDGVNPWVAGYRSVLH